MARLEPGRQALLRPGHLRNGDTYTGLAIGVATAWRYIRGAIALLSAAADDLHTAMKRFQTSAQLGPLVSNTGLLGAWTMSS